MQIAERLERLKQHNRNNNNNDNNNNDDDNDDDNDVPPPPSPTPSFGPLPYSPPLPSTDSDIEDDLNPTQKFLHEDIPQQEKIAVAVEEKTKTVRFSENVNKFPKADEIFDDNEKINIDNDDLPGITIPNTQTLFKELNDGKLPEELKFFSGGTDRGNELRFHAMQNIGMLDESNEHFLDYLLLNFAQEILSKKKKKKKTTHLDTGNTYYNNLNMRESI